VTSLGQTLTLTHNFRNRGLQEISATSFGAPELQLGFYERFSIKSVQLFTFFTISANFHVLSKFAQLPIKNSNRESVGIQPTHVATAQNSKKI